MHTVKNSFAAQSKYIKALQGCFPSRVDEITYILMGNKFKIYVFSASCFVQSV